LLYFDSGAFRPDPGEAPHLRRGRYVVEALAHCGECHTPRNRLGGFRRGMFLAGTKTGPEGAAIPNLTPDPDTGIGRWSVSDVAQLLQTGMTRDGDFVGGAMAEVVDESTSRLTDSDRVAVASFLRTVAPVRNAVERKKAKARKLEW
jgi:mono/diheme cytochrome c family protein